MMYKPRVLELVEELLDTGRTVEEVCASSPELLPEVKEYLHQCQNLETKIDALFPPASELQWRSILNHEELPQVPGYRVESVLGRGGTGVVYKATHLKLNRPIALKMLLSGDFASKGERNRFLSEAEAVAALHHPHIVQVYDSGDFNGRPYYTMEYAEGGSLAQKLAGIPQPSADAVSLISILADAVDAAHRAGIVHRDLKPSNILLTHDGVAKIADFGLARRIDRDPAITFSGARVGTPSYMAPEQAAGKTDAFCPCVDIYSLGAIFYESLTGRPPFQAETSEETQRQVIEEEPVPPSYLNVKVPRDVETICLKCLHKNISRRYSTGAELAEDLRRHQRGEPIAARRTGMIERGVKWVKRRPTLTTGLATSLVLLAAIAAVMIWFGIRQSQREHAVASDLREMASLQTQARWIEARAVLDRASARLDGAGTVDLLDRIARAKTDLDLVIHLDDIHLSRVTSGNLAYYKLQADTDYERAFREAHLATLVEPPKDSAKRIRISAVHEALEAALDDWAVCSSTNERRQWLLNVANLSDVSPSHWRVEIRDDTTWLDLPTLTRLVNQVPVQEEPVSLLLSLAERLKIAGGNPTSFLGRVQAAWPADFWTNLILGNALLDFDPKEARSFYRASLASRPDAAVNYCVIGDSLRRQHQLDEAIDYYRKSLRLNPSYARACTDLGIALNSQGHFDEAIKFCQRALDIDPHYAWAHFDMAQALHDAHRDEDAIDQYNQFIAINSGFSPAYSRLGDLQKEFDRLDKAIDAYSKALKIDPSDGWAHFQLGNTLKLAGRQQEALATYQRFIIAHTQFPWAYNNLGNQLRDSGKSADAIPYYKSALRIDPSYVWGYVDMARALKGLGNKEEAVACYRQVLILDPKNIEALSALRGIDVQQGRGEAVLASWREVLESNPADYAAWTGYPELCLFLNHPDEYRAIRQQMLDRFADATDAQVAEGVARACLLLPDASPSEIERAAMLANRALELNHSQKEGAYRYFVFAQGLAQYRQGRFTEALATMRGDAHTVLGPCPEMVSAMAQYQLGNKTQARGTLAAALAKFDWSPAKTSQRDVWIYHILRREAEKMIVSDDQSTNGK